MAMSGPYQIMNSTLINTCCNTILSVQTIEPCVPNHPHKYTVLIPLQITWLLPCLCSVSEMLLPRLASVRRKLTRKFPSLRQLLVPLLHRQHSCNMRNLPLQPEQPLLWGQFLLRVLRRRPMSVLRWLWL